MILKVVFKENENLIITKKIVNPFLKFIYKSSIMNFIWYILIGILAGYFAGKIMRGGGFGLLVNLLLGIIGGVLGGWVFALLGLAATGIIGSLITSVVGAILFLWIASFFSRSR